MLKSKSYYGSQIDAQSVSLHSFVAAESIAAKINTANNAERPASKGPPLAV